MISIDEEDIEYQLLFKIIIVGDSSVGKTNILSRYINNEFKHELLDTIGVELNTKYIKIKGKNAKLQIWDTAGQERYHSIITSYYKGSLGCFIVYDITNQQSFDDLDKWFEECKLHAHKEATIILVGNKCDLEKQRKITKQMGEEKAKKLNCPFFETSALSNINIEDIFNVINEAIYEKLSNKGIDVGNKNKIKKKGKKGVDITTQSDENNKSGCC